MNIYLFFENKFDKIKFEYLLKQNLIPIRHTNEEDFLNQRSKMMLDFINNYFNA